MKKLPRLPRRQTRAIRPAERYLAAGVEEARRLGHGYVGTEHVLLALTRNPQGGAMRALGRHGVTPEDVQGSAFLASVWAPLIEPDPPKQTRAGIHCIAPRLKRALAGALDRAGTEPLRDEHVLLGMLSIRDCLAARALAELGVSLEAAEAVVPPSPRES